jgi:hypothetical protein
MTRTGYVDARNYGDSPQMRVYVPIASAVFESCLRITTPAVQKSGLHHQSAAQFEAPLRVDRGVLATPSQARARDLAPTLCRALMVQAASACRTKVPFDKLRAHQSKASSPIPRHSREGTLQALRRRLLSH